MIQASGCGHTSPAAGCLPCQVRGGASLTATRAAGRVSCPLLGDVLRRCPKGCSRSVRRCLHPDNRSAECTTGPNDETGGMWSCSDCPDRPRETPPTRRTRVPGLPDHFNAGMLEHEGRLLLLSRKGSRLHLSSLDPATYRPSWTKPLDFPGLPGGHEDGRLYTVRGKLRASFTYTAMSGGRARVRQAYADLESGEAHAVTHGGPTEKNWGFFEYGREQYAVYSIWPRHVVLRVDGDRAEVVADTENPFPWLGGHARGGSPPTFDGGAFTCWFHGAIDHGAGLRTYSVGRYRFRAAPPFDVLEQTESPLLWARQSEAHPERPLVPVIFPCGAVRRPDRWLVSCGVADKRVDVMEWPA